jgi:hypothetical protein
MQNYPFQMTLRLGVELPTRDGRSGAGDRLAGLDEPRNEGQAGQVGPSPAVGLVPDPVQV